MKKLLLILLILSLSISLLGCGSNSDTNSSASETNQNTDSVSESDLNFPDDSEDALSNENAPVDNEKLFAKYNELIENSYDSIMELTFGSISGIGFADLDRDGGMEMILFDGGASAAMGIILFDIVDDNIQLISAYGPTENAAYGLDYFSDTFISANFFEDFRKMKSLETEDEFFLLESGNGNMEFIYRDLIRFGKGEKGQLTLEALMHRTENFDVETGDPTTAEYSVGGESCDKEAYDKAASQFYSGCYDTGFDAPGVFLWEDPSSPEMSKDRLSLMAEEAFSRFKTSIKE